MPESAIDNWLSVGPEAGSADAFEDATRRATAYERVIRASEARARW